MRCPFCGAADTRVVDSRLSPEGHGVRRRRACGGCGERFTTREVAELVLPRVVKGDGSREVFNEEKLRSGMLKALEKRPVGEDTLEASIQRVVHAAQATGEREIPSRQIGEWVMTELRELDQVAYVRFASVYRSFEDVDAFKREVERLKQRSS